MASDAVVERVSEPGAIRYVAALSRSVELRGGVSEVPTTGAGSVPRALAGRAAVSSPLDLAERLDMLADMFTSGDLPAVFAGAFEVAAAARAGGDLVAEARAEHLLSLSFEAAGDCGLALEHSLRAEETYAASGEDSPARLGTILNTRASIHHVMGDTARARAAYIAALETSKGSLNETPSQAEVWTSSRKRITALIYSNLVELALETKDWSDALAMGECALDVVSDVDVDQAWLSMVHVISLSYMAIAHLNLGEEAAARSCLERADAILAVSDATERDWVVDTAHARRWFAWGSLHRAAGDFPLAIKSWTEARRAAANALPAREDLTLVEHLVEAHKALGAFETALGLFEEYVELYTKLFSREADLRFRSLQVVNDTLAALRHAEVMAMRAEEFEQLALTDALTGLLNRRRFTELLDEAFDMSRSEDKAVVMFDIDYFKRVNDTYGHSVGDDVLRAAAACAAEHAAGLGVIARVGGEEFAIIVNGTVAAAAAVAERIRVALTGIRFEHAAEVKVSASFGVASFAGAGAPGDVMRSADMGLYAAKNGGRNRVVVVDGAATGSTSSLCAGAGADTSGVDCAASDGVNTAAAVWVVSSTVADRLRDRRHRP